MVLLVVIAGAIYALVVLKPWGGAQLSDQERRAQQENQLAEAVKTNDPTQCEKLKDNMTGDSSDKIACEGNIYMALAQEKLDVSYCDKLDNKSFSTAMCKSGVIALKAATATSVATCDIFNDAGLKSECLTAVNLKLLVEGAQVDCAVFPPPLAADCKQFKNVIAKKPVSATACSTIQHPGLQEVCNSKNQ